MTAYDQVAYIITSGVMLVAALYVAVLLVPVIVAGWMGFSLACACVFVGIPMWLAQGLWWLLRCGCRACCERRGEPWRAVPGRRPPDGPESLRAWWSEPPPWGRCPSGQSATDWDHLGNSGGSA